MRTAERVIHRSAHRLCFFPKSAWTWKFFAQPVNVLQPGRWPRLRGACHLFSHLLPCALMMLCSILPVPRNTYVPPELPDAPAVVAPSRRDPPAYGHRQGFIPRSLEDFGDGGAFPEIHVAQYPLDMGRKGKTSSTAIVPVQVDSESGKIRYDALISKGSCCATLGWRNRLLMSKQERRRWCILPTRTWCRQRG